MTTTNLVNKWYQENINAAALDKKVEATLEYVKRFNEPDEEGDWVVFAYEVVSGAHGIHTVPLFLNEMAGEGLWTADNDSDELLGEFDEVSHMLAEAFNANTDLPGTFYVGHNEADGSLGVFYSVKA